MKFLNLFFILLFTSAIIQAQIIPAALPENINRTDKYCFYLHGGVVTALGDMAVTLSVPEWGRYEYLNILDSLKKRGFVVISENRKPHVDDQVYAGKINKQIDTLLKAGVPERNIILVGASAGSAIALQVAAKRKNKQLKYVIMGACRPDTYKSYDSITLRGQFLSIIEASDPHGTCTAIFEGRKQVKVFKEVVLHTGLSHSFLFKGYAAWIDPVMEWFENGK